MRYWWVNQNQTFRQETEGGYLWSPKRNKNGARNPFYESMREVSPGDLVFSFQGTYLRKIGVIQSHGYECPKPAEFGSTGPNWDNIGWKVDVIYYDLSHQIRPADYMDVLAPVLPERYSPLQANGRGKQSVYLTELPQPFARTLANLIGHQVQVLMQSQSVAEPIGSHGQGVIEWEEHLRQTIETDPEIGETDREQLVLARRGQGRFRDYVTRIERRCRITGVNRSEHLRASHIKPWRDSGNAERLDGENGLLLTPSIDHLFDRGFISFEDGGRLLVSPVAHAPSLTKMGVSVDEKVDVGPFTEGQRGFLDFHREYVFLERRRS